jgi:hypothetical protein
MTPKKDKLEVSSDQLRAELIEIKERVGALETIASISNRVEVEKYIRLHLTNIQRKQILQECAEPRTRQYLKQKFNFSSPQALDVHLKPLRDSDLIHQRFDDDGKQTFVQSKLVQGLPKTTLKKLFE